MEYVGDILVLDDSKEIADLVADLLTDEGYIVRVAHTSDEALRLIADRRPDVAIVDLYLPQRIGDSFGRSINASGLTPIPVIIMTADLKSARELDMDGIAYCLTKPFDLDELICSVGELARRELAAA
ncbi:MAG TPA: response regulator [Roseiflexaceae bacterium]|nr:response regulator [Roseiflexaceae bacterium]